MDKLTVKLEPRTITGKKVKTLRRQGLVPASTCGKDVPNENFQINARDFNLVYRRVGRNGLIELDMPGGTKSAFVRQVQRHPVRGDYLHVDFRIVDLRTPITADVPIVATGENELIERGEGVLSLMLPTLSVRALPTDLPQNIEIDIARIPDLTTTLFVRDLDLGSAIEVLSPPDEAVITITASRMEAEAEEIAEQEAAGDEELAADDAATDPDAGVGPVETDEEESA